MLIILFFAISFQQKTFSQVSVTINIGAQPDWGPVGYDYVDYYYMPDIDAYYYVPERKYIYFESKRWVFAPVLPARYKWYNPYKGYKVVVNEPRPYEHHDIYRTRYAKYKGGHGPKQEVIKYSHDNRYKNNGPGNSQHEDHGNGKNKGKGKGHGRGH